MQLRVSWGAMGTQTSSKAVCQPTPTAHRRVGEMHIVVAMTNDHRCRALVLYVAVVVALFVAMPSRHASAEPLAECPLTDAAGLSCAPAGGEATAPGNVGTVVHVVIHRSFAQTSTADQCVGAGALEPLQRGSSALLSDGAAAPDSRKVAVGVFIRSRMKDGMCEVLYIGSAPVLPVFNVQFTGPSGGATVNFGPIRSEPVTDQDGIQQALRVDMEFAAQ